MTDPEIATWLDTIAGQLRNCATITHDLAAIDILIDSARALTTRAQEIRTRDLLTNRMQRANEPKEKP